MNLDKIAFAYPCRPWRLIKIDAGLVDEYYYQLFGQWHRGVDINGIYGGDSDLGLPVQSMFPGEVIDVVNARGWGQTVLVRSEAWVRDYVEEQLDIDLPVLDVQYTHLHQVTVEEGDYINSGDHVGSIGKGDRGQYPAHLHMEVRRLPLPATVPQGSSNEDREAVLEKCLDPERLFAVLPFENYTTVMGQGRQVAPVDRMIHNGAVIEGSRQIVMNRQGRMMHFYDQRPPAPTPATFFEALRYAVRLWQDRT